MSDDHLSSAVLRLNQARDRSHRTVDTSVEANASLATAHAVLALIDIITGDRETEIQDARSYILQLEKANRALQLRVQELSDQLDGCNDTVRRHEQAATANAKPDNNDLRKSYE